MAQWVSSFLDTGILSDYKSTYPPDPAIILPIIEEPERLPLIIAHYLPDAIEIEQRLYFS